MGEAFSHFEKLSGDSFGGTGSLAGDAVIRATVAGLLVGVLNRLGGALQEDQQPAISDSINSDDKSERRKLFTPLAFILCLRLKKRVPLESLKLTVASAQKSRRIVLRRHPVDVQTNHIARVRICRGGGLLRASMTKDQAAEEAAYP